MTRFVVAHLTDSHMGATDEAPARLRRALAHVAACSPPPDVLVLSGDLADHGLDAEYELAAELLSTVTIPPCRSTIAFTIERPRPLPPP